MTGVQTCALPIYHSTLGRDPDAAGFSDWMESLGSGTAYLDVATGFVASTEFQNSYGALSDADFVELLYQNVLKRSADADGLASWTRLLSEGHSRAEVVQGFAQSREHIAATAEDLAVFMRALGNGDVLQLLSGANHVIGGTYADTFVFGAVSGAQSEIWDFEIWDQLTLSGFGFATVSEALAYFSQQGAHVVFDHQDARLTLLDADIALLSSDNIFVA